MAKTKTFDAIIIGEGVIGNALALELTRLGWKTISVDMLPTTGCGSTSSSCAIIRVYYSAIDGFYMACGTSGNQFKNAPVAGKLMAQPVDYCEAGNNHDTHPLSFALSHTEFVLDTTTMSRLRTINVDSSFSVLG